MIGHGQMPIAGMQRRKEMESSATGSSTWTEIALHCGSAERYHHRLAWDECIEIVCGFCAKVNRLIDKSLRQRCRPPPRRRSTRSENCSRLCFDNVERPQLQSASK